MSLGITNSQSFLPGEMGLLLGTLDVPFFTREKIDKMCKLLVIQMEYWYILERFLLQLAILFRLHYHRMYRILGFE